MKNEDSLLVNMDFVHMLQSSGFKYLEYTSDGCLYFWVFDDFLLHQPFPFPTSDGGLFRFHRGCAYIIPSPEKKSNS